MFKTKIIHGKSINAYQNIENDGYKKIMLDSDDIHEVLRKHFKTSPANSRTLFVKNDRIYIFDKWLGDFPYKELQLVDVTDLLLENMIIFEEREVIK